MGATATGDHPAETKTSISSGIPVDKIAQSISKVDFRLGLDNASASMIREHILKNDNREEMRMHALEMGENEFFRQFISKYQKGLARTLKTTIEKTEAESNSAALGSSQKKPTTEGSKSQKPGAAVKTSKKANFGKQIMDHVSNTNYYRKNLPSIFTGESNTDHTGILQEKLKTLTPVPLPLEL